MKDVRTKKNAPAGDGSKLQSAKAKRRGRKPVVKPLDDLLAKMCSLSRDEQDGYDDDDAPQRLQQPPEWRLDMLERLVERIINVESVKAALDADECFAVRVQTS